MRSGAHNIFLKYDQSMHLLYDLRHTEHAFCIRFRPAEHALCKVSGPTKQVPKSIRQSPNPSLRQLFKTKDEQGPPLSTRRPAGRRTGVPQPGGKHPKYQNQLDRATKSIAESAFENRERVGRRSAGQLNGVPQPRRQKLQVQNQLDGNKSVSGSLF